MRRAFTLVGYVFGALYAAFALACMAKMSGSLGTFLDPIGLVFSLWVLSPVALPTWLQSTSRLWWFALLPAGIFGALAMYDMAFHPGSSTAALGLIFFPFYQWVFVGVVGLIIVAIDFAQGRLGEHK